MRQHSSGRTRPDTGHVRGHILPSKGAAAARASPRLNRPALVDDPERDVNPTRYPQAHGAWRLSTLGAADARAAKSASDTNVIDEDEGAVVDWVGKDRM